MKLAMAFLATALVLSVAVGYGSAAATMAAKSASEATQTTLTGSIIDNMCATSHKDSLSTFVPGHTKECALMPNCKASGYSLYTSGGKLVSFNRASDKKIVPFLEKKKSTLQVTVSADQVGDSLNLISIKNATAMKK